MRLRAQHETAVGRLGVLASISRFVWSLSLAALAPDHADPADVFEPARVQLTNDIGRLEATNTPSRKTERVLRKLHSALTLIDTSAAGERTLWRVAKLLGRRDFPAYEPVFQYAAQMLALELSTQVSNVTTLAFDLPPLARAPVAQRRAESLLNAMARQAAVTNVWQRAPLLYRARLAFYPAQTAALRAVPLQMGDLDVQLRLRFARRYVSNDEPYRFPGTFSQLFLDSDWQKTVVAYRTPTNLQVSFSASYLPSGSFYLSGGINAAPGHYRFPHGWRRAFARIHVWHQHVLANLRGQLVCLHK